MVSVWLMIDLLVFVVCGVSYSLLLPNVKQNIFLARRAENFLLPEHELKKRKGGRWVYRLSLLVPKAEDALRLNIILRGDMKKILKLMGSHQSYEQIVAEALIKSGIMGLALLVVPVMTGFAGYLLLAPLGFCILFFVQIHSIFKSFKKWQNSLIKDLPLLIDKIQISLEAGKPILHALQQVNKSSSPRMAKMLDNLILDMQSMKQTEALDRFARCTGIPEVLNFSAAVKIAIENGYDKARPNFDSLKIDIRKLRVLSLNELTRSKPENLWKLQVLMALNAAAAMAFTFYVVFSDAARAM